MINLSSETDLFAPPYRRTPLIKQADKLFNQLYQQCVMTRLDTPYNARLQHVLRRAAKRCFLRRLLVHATPTVAQEDLLYNTLVGAVEGRDAYEAVKDAQSYLRREDRAPWWMEEEAVRRSFVDYFAPPEVL